MASASPGRAGPATFVDVIRGLDHPTSGITFASAPAEVVSYAALGALVRGNARHLAGSGVGRGDRVAIAIASDLEHVVATLALIALGAVPVSVKPSRGASDDGYASSLQRLVTRYGVRFAYRSLPELGVAAVAWDPGAAAGDDSVLAAVDPDDTCIIQFSSGSLGDPKPVPIRHASLVENIRAIIALDRRLPSTWCWTFLPLSHDMGLVGGLLTNLTFQNPLYLSTPQRFLRRPLEFFQWSEGRDCGIAMPEFALRYLVRHLAGRASKPDPRLLSGIRTIYCGAEPIRHETIAAVVEAAPAWGLDPGALIFCYGMAEATLLVTAHRFRSLAESFADGPGERRIACVGTPAPGTEVVVRTPDGAPAAPGAEGDIFVRGPGVCRGYVDAPALADGWHDTGDVGFLQGGDLYITGRVKEVIIINGENLFPHDIEELVGGIPGVRDCMVMNDGDQFFVAVVAPQALELADLAARVLARFGAAPAGIAIASPAELVRTTSGKPMRHATLQALRARMRTS